MQSCLVVIGIIIIIIIVVICEQSYIYIYIYIYISSVQSTIFHLLGTNFVHMYPYDMHMHVFFLILLHIFNLKTNFSLLLLKLFCHKNVIKNKYFLFSIKTNIMRSIRNYWLHVEHCICRVLEGDHQIRRWHCMGLAKGLTYNIDGCSVQSTRITWMSDQWQISCLCGLAVRALTQKVRGIRFNSLQGH